MCLFGPTQRPLVVVRWAALPPAAAAAAPRHPPQVRSPFDSSSRALKHPRILGPANDSIVPRITGRAGPHFPSLGVKSTGAVGARSTPDSPERAGSSAMSTHHCVPARRRNSCRSSETAGGFRTRGGGQSFPPLTCLLWPPAMFCFASPLFHDEIKVFGY